MAREEDGEVGGEAGMNTRNAIRLLFARVARLEREAGIEPRGPGRSGIASPRRERSEPGRCRADPGTEAASGDGEELAELSPGL